MDDIAFFALLECLQDLDCEPSNQAQREPLEVVVFNEFVQVDTQQFEGHADVFAEQKGVAYAHNVVVFFWVSIPQSLQEFDFHHRLLVETFAIPD